MSPVPTGKRSWKCPECGGESLLSITQLDPIACDVCLAKMKAGGKAGLPRGIPDSIAGPLAIWTSLPEMTKLGIAFAGLVAGFLIGYVAGQATVSSHPEAKKGMARGKESVHSKETTSEEESSLSDETHDRPEAPGPGYKWVRGRKKEDGTRGAGHWAKDPFYKGDDESAKTKTK